MIKHFVIFGIIVIVATVLGINFYLQIDNLAGCGEKPDNTASCQKADAIVAISGGDTTARTNEAITFYKNGWADTLIFSGAAQDKSGPSNAAVMKKNAISAGVPESAIMIDEYSETTKQNAENSISLFTKNNIKSVILVTSGYHQRRASLEFDKRASGIKVLSHPVKSDKDWSLFWWLSPTGWFLAVSELIKIGIFYASGAI